MMQRFSGKRRRLLLGAAGMLATVPLQAAQRLLPATPPQTAGPFYPVELPLDDDNDLTKIRGRIGRPKGQITDLSGRLLDLNGRPLPKFRIEIWQCDANGRYHHPYDDGDRPVDEHFQGHGSTLSSQQGEYRFRTIRPVPYPGRTPHIHLAVFPPGHRPFVTQLYVKGDPRNDMDFVYRRVPVEHRHLVVAEFAPAGRAEVEFAASFDVVLGGVSGEELKRGS